MIRTFIVGIACFCAGYALASLAASTRDLFGPERSFDVVQDAVLSGDRDQIRAALSAGARERARARMQRTRDLFGTRKDAAAWDALERDTGFQVGMELARQDMAAGRVTPFVHRTPRPTTPTGPDSYLADLHWNETGEYLDVWRVVPHG